MLVIATFSCHSPLAAAESSDSEAIHNVLDSFIGAYFDSDFPRLVSLLHPRSQRLFREELSAAFDRLLRVYSLGQLSAVSGLPAHPKDLPLSDSEFFVFACRQATERHPEVIPDRSFLPFDIRESVFHGDTLDVSLSYFQHVQTERTNYGVIFPVVVVLQHEPIGWQVLSCPLSRAIATNWKGDLVRAGVTHVR